MAQPRKKRILLIEDDRSLQIAMRYTIEDLGYEIVVAGDEARAASAILEGPYDAAVVDYFIENASAAGLIADLRRRYPHMPLVCSTGACAEQMELESDLLRPDAYLYKPFAPDQLRATLNALLLS
jgi:two-component system, OmpR family, response regulator PhoP